MLEPDSNSMTSGGCIHVLQWIGFREVDKKGDLGSKLLRDMRGRKVEILSLLFSNRGEAGTAT